MVSPSLNLLPHHHQHSEGPKAELNQLHQHWGYSGGERVGILWQVTRLLTLSTKSDVWWSTLRLPGGLELCRDLDILIPSTKKELIRLPSYLSSWVVTLPTTRCSVAALCIIYKMEPILAKVTKMAPSKLSCSDIEGMWHMEASLEGGLWVKIKCR